MKRLAAITLLAALCALPAAQGASTNLTMSAKHALTPIGATPTKNDIIAAFPARNPVTELSFAALNNDEDLGIRLRAIRALPEFCLPSCAGTPAHDALIALLSVSVPDKPAQTLLLLRATIEAIGTAKGGVADVNPIIGYLAHPSRDVRATTALALRDLCQPSATEKLRTAYNSETVMQVRLAISTALRDLATCTN